MNSEFAAVRISPCLRIFIDSLLDEVDIASPTLMFAPEEETRRAATTLSSRVETDVLQRLGYKRPRAHERRARV